MKLKAISTVIASILMLMIVIALGGTTYLYVSGTLIGKISTTFEIVDSINDTVIIRNSGTEPLTSITATLNGNTANTAVVPNIPGLVGYWSLNEGSGTTTDDNSDNNNIGTLSPSCPDCPSRIVGKHGNALLFDGTNDYVSVTSTASLRPTTALTVTAWVRAITSGRWTIIAVHELNVETATWALLVGNFGGTNGRPSFLTNNGTFTNTNSATISMATTNISANTISWYFLAGVYNGTHNVIYVNGVEEAVAAHAVANDGIGGYDTSDIVAIGGDTTGGFADLRGEVDEVVVYNRALSESEIKQLYSGLVSPGQVATIKPLATLTKGTHTLRLCTSSMCNTAILTIT